MYQIGKINQLEVFRESPHGMYLMDEDGHEVLLPNKYVPEGLEIDDDIEVFLFKDSEDRITATTQRPKILLNEFASLQVRQISEFGAFLDWGLDKDLLVPFAEQSRKMQKGEWHIVYLYIDEQTNRLVASSKLSRHVEKQDIELSNGQEVDLLIGRPTDIGFNVIIDNRYQGLIYKNEIFRDIRMGHQTKGFIKLIRPDGKIDVSLQRQGFQAIETHAEKILLRLKQKGGFLPLHDKSSPEEITKQLQMSKKNFKRAIGGLYKKGTIKISPEGIRLQ